MLPFKKILCPVDFSESSIDALKAANELSVHFSSELIVVHVIPPMTVPVAPEGMPQPMLDVVQYERSLRDHYGRLLPEVVSRNLSKQVRVQSFILHGDVAHEIARVSKENDVDLIVVAPHSHSGLRRFIFGSLAQKITRLAPCPVMTLVSRDQEAVSIGAEGSGEKKPGQRDVYQEKIEDRDLKTDELKARLEKSKSEMRIGPGEQIDELRKKQEEARRKVQQIRPSGDDAWEDLQTDAEQAMTNLKEAIGLAVSRFKNEK